MRHSLIYRKARQLDKYIDNYRKRKGRTTFPHRELGAVIEFLFPGSSVSGRGAYMTVHKVSSRARELVLKTGENHAIKNDIKVYKRIPKDLRNRYFAKVYWRTKYCVLQKYGQRDRVPPSELERLKQIGAKYGLKDIRPANVRKVDGRFKIVDASIRKGKR